LSDILSVKKNLAGLIEQAAEKAQKEGKLPSVNLHEITVEHPQNSEHGDFASSLPLRIARTTALKPLDIARTIAEFIEPSEEIESATAAPPGFINFCLKDSWLSSQVGQIIKEGKNYGDIDLGKSEKVQIEFVSANPTGPIHVGHGRGAVLGSTLANVLTAAGYDVQREFYLNDAGSQVDAFKRSLYARYRQELGQPAEVPEDGYHGDYMMELAKNIVAEDGDKYLKITEEDALNYLGGIGLKMMTNQIENDLESLGVSFHNWFSELTLYSGIYHKVIEILKKKGYLVDKEGATWFASSALGEDKDNVVVRSDGSPTYFATDIAYHYDKFLKRKFNSVINIWGADHQGHVSRMKAVLSALDIEPERLKIIIAQMVTLKRGKDIVRLSKRGGEIITLKEVIDEVGSDACRFFFLARSADSQMDFDLELAKRESTENPVYYIQYAHARIASIMKLAAEKRIDYDDGDVSLLTSEPELSLIRRMLLLSEMVEMITQALEPHHLTYYAQELATVFHSFYKQCRVVSGDDQALTKARLKLVAAARITLARTLNLMGMNAPDTM